MRRLSTSLLIVMVFVLALVAPIPSAAQAKPEKSAPSALAKPSLGDFDDFVNQALKDWKVPGVAVAVVQGDKVILLKGYGYRDLEKQLPVTPSTLFAIGSISKSLPRATPCVGMDEGKVDWDKPVRDYLPMFKMFDPVLPEQMQ